jgi:hypothetical protein
MRLAAATATLGARRSRLLRSGIGRGVRLCLWRTRGVCSRRFGDRFLSATTPSAALAALFVLMVIKPSVRRGRVVEAGLPAVFVVPRSLYRRCRRDLTRLVLHAGRLRSVRIKTGFGRSRSGCIRIRFGVLHGFSLLAPRCPKGAAGAIFLLLGKWYQQMPISPSNFVEDRGLHFFR